MSTLKEQVLRDIKENGIKPASKFYFVTRNYFFWLLFVVSVIVGALAFSSILFELVLDQEYYRSLSLFSAPSLLLQSVPFFWIALLGVFTASAWFNFKRTDGAHRRENGMVVLSSVLFSLLFGILIFRLGVAEHLDQVFAENVTSYRALTEKRLESKAEFLRNLDQDPRAVLLRRERLRTLCLNQGRDDCFAVLAELSDEEVALELEQAETEEGTEPAVKETTQ